MARGLPYDSDDGRAYAAAITALMTGRAYRKSAEVASRMGPFAGYQPNAAAMIGVIAKHRAAVGNIEHTELRAGRPARGRAQGLGRRARPRRGARLPQRAGDACSRRRAASSATASSSTEPRPRPAATASATPSATKWQGARPRGRDRRGPAPGDEVLRQRRRAGRDGRDGPRLPHPGHADAPRSRWSTSDGDVGVEALRRDRAPATASR